MFQELGYAHCNIKVVTMFPYLNLKKVLGVLVLKKIIPMYGWQTKCFCSNEVGSHFCNEHGGLVCVQSSSSPLGCHQTSYVLHLILEYVIGEGRKTFLLKF